MAGGTPHKPSPRVDRPFGERHRRRLFDVALCDRNRDLVARNEELASEPEGEPGSELSAHELGRAQRARFLVFRFYSDVGNFWNLFVLPTMVQCPGHFRSGGSS